jgi:hypothetical protein
MISVDSYNLVIWTLKQTDSGSNYLTWDTECKRLSKHGPYIFYINRVLFEIDKFIKSLIVILPNSSEWVTDSWINNSHIPIFLQTEMYSYAISSIELTMTISPRCSPQFYNPSHTQFITLFIRMLFVHMAALHLQFITELSSHYCKLTYEHYCTFILNDRNNENK